MKRARSLRPSFASLAFVAAIASCAFVLASCATTQTWRGKITDCKTTKPIEEADVQLAVTGPKESKSNGKTSSDGSFAFATPGATKESTASITATKRGYQVTQASLGAPPGASEPLCMEPTR
jgi:hypothetical protein